MRIVCINQYFWPDLAPTGLLLEDVVTKLAADGHEVVVLCADRRYRRCGEDRPAPPVSIRRLPALSLGSGRIGKAWSFVTFFLCAAIAALREKPVDVIITMTTPPLIGVVGALLGCLRGARHFVWEMDLYPEIAADVGLLSRRSLIYRALESIAAFIRTSADGVLVLGDCMQRRLLAAGVPQQRLHVVENWAVGRILAPREAEESTGVQVLYSGNAGLGHDFETVCSAMVILNRDSAIRFRFCGHGPAFAPLRQFCEKKRLLNVEFSGFLDRADFDEALARCDVGLVTQRMSCSGSLVPSKVYGLLAAGRPILFIGPRDATAARIIDRHHCGWHVDCDEPERVASLLRLLATDRERIRSAAENASRAFFEHYRTDAGVGRFVRALGLETSLAR